MKRRLLIACAVAGTLAPPLFAAELPETADFLAIATQLVNFAEADDQAAAAALVDDYREAARTLRDAMRSIAEPLEALYFAGGGQNDETDPVFNAMISSSQTGMDVALVGYPLVRYAREGDAVDRTNTIAALTNAVASVIETDAKLGAMANVLATSSIPAHVVTRVDAPSVVAPGQKIQVRLTMRNVGMETVSNVTVRIDSAPFTPKSGQQASIGDIPPGEDAVHIFNTSIAKDARNRAVLVVQALANNVDWPRATMLTLDVEEKP